MTGPWWSLLSYTAFLTYLVLAVVVLRRGPRAALNWSCALFLLALACWSLEDVFHGNPALAENYVRMFSHIGTVGRASGGSLFLWFVLLLTGREWLLRRWWLYPLLIGAPVAFAVGLWTGAFPAVARLHSFGWVVFWPNSAWSVAYYGYLVLTLTIAIGLLWQARQRATEPNVRRRLGLIIATTVLAFLLAVLFDVVLSSSPRPLPELGSSLALIWAIGLTVSMTRHGLLAVEPERAARETLATIPDAVLLLGADGRISSANPALAGLTGQPVEAAIGRPVTELFTHPELAAEELAETWVAQRRRTFALECRAADGSVVPVSVKDQAIRAGKRLVGAVWILHDERDRVQAELARRVSAENYRSFVQNFAGIAFEADLDFRIRFLHGAVREITGYDAAEFESGRVRWRDIIHPDDVARLRAGTKRLRTVANCTVVRDYRIIRQDGSIGWVQERLWNVTGPDGQPVRIHGTVTDVTEQRRTMEELAELNRFRASIIDNANILLVVVDPEMRVVVWNKAAERITGYQQAEVVGRVDIWRRLFPDEGERRRLQAENRSFIEQGLARSNVDAPIVCADGRQREVNWTFQPMVGPDGKLSNFVMLGEDVTELRQAQREQDRHLRDLTLLAQTAMELTDIALEADIYGLVAERLQQLTGAALVFVNTFDAATSLLTVRAAFGLDAKQATGLIGQPPFGFTIRIDAERRELLRSGTLVPIPGGLRQVGTGVLPDIACQVLEQFYGLGQAYAIGFVWQGELVGNAIILLPAGAKLTDPSAVEALVRQAASAMRRRAAEAALRESEQRYRAVVENAGDGIAIVQDGLVVYANPSLCRLAGREPAEVINRPFTEFLAAESRATVLDYYQRRMAGEAVPADYQAVLGLADLRANVEISARVIDYGGRPADLVVVRGVGLAARSASAASHQKPDR